MQYFYTEFKFHMNNSTNNECFTGLSAKIVAIVSKFFKSAIGIWQCPRYDWSFEEGSCWIDKSSQTKVWMNKFSIHGHIFCHIRVQKRQILKLYIISPRKIVLTGGPRLMQISLLRISLLRFFKTFLKNLAYTMIWLIISLLQSQYFKIELAKYFCKFYADFGNTSDLGMQLWYKYYLHTLTLCYW